MNSQPPRRLRRRWPLAALALVILFVSGFAVVRADVLGMGERFDRWAARVETIINPPPDRSTIPTVVVPPEPSPSPTLRPTPAASDEPQATPSPSPTPLLRTAVDVNLVQDAAAVFASQLTEKDCAVAGTQMVLTILGLGNTSAAFQTELHDRIGEWESWEDSHNGGWGPAAVSLALAAYGAPGYEIRAYASHLDALRGAATALSATGKPVVLFPWWGAHTWVMTGYRADADPLLFSDANVSGLYILDPWHPRTSSIWGYSDPPGNFEDLAEMERNWPAGAGPPGFEAVGPGWTRPEGAYPGRDGMYVILIPTIPLDS
ncbi:MAG: hypothetical protein QOI85_703 [Chloroflexota bacterium]|nr:hypothetical protein [Chloroflexota bacterium]